MKNAIEKISSVLKTIFGYGIMISLFGGGLTFFGYIAALIIGGETAQMICSFIYNDYIPQVVYFSSVMVLLGLLTMYLDRTHSLTAKKKEQ